MAFAKPASKIAALLFSDPARVLPFGKTTGASGSMRLLDVGEMRQHFVLDFHETRGVDGAFFGVGGDRRNGVALVHHLRAGLLVFERRLERQEPSAPPTDRWRQCVRADAASGRFCRRSSRDD